MACHGSESDYMRFWKETQPQQTAMRGDLHQHGSYLHTTDDFLSKNEMQIVLSYFWTCSDSKQMMSSLYKFVSLLASVFMCLNKRSTQWSNLGQQYDCSNLKNLNCTVKKKKKKKDLSFRIHNNELHSFELRRFHLGNLEKKTFYTKSKAEWLF